MASVGSAPGVRGLELRIIAPCFALGIVVALGFVVAREGTSGRLIPAMALLAGPIALWIGSWIWSGRVAFLLRLLGVSWMVIGALALVSFILIFGPLVVLALPALWPGARDESGRPAWW